MEEEKDGKDEAICPTDMNLICDDDLRLIFKPLPEGTIFTMISDCCHSGGMLDHTEVQIEVSVVYCRHCTRHRASKGGCTTWRLQLLCTC